jgi:maspardin
LTQRGKGGKETKERAKALLPYPLRLRFLRAFASKLTMKRLLLLSLWRRPVSFARLYAAVDPAARESLQNFRQTCPVRQIEANGLSWKYVTLGEGKQTILFLHGLAGSHDIWWQQIVALQDRYRLVSVTYAAADSLAAMAEGLLAILAENQIERVSVVGSSLGGYLAQYLLAAHPDRIERAVLANTFPPNEVIARTYRLPTALLPYASEWLVMAVMRASYRLQIYPSSGHSELVLAFLREMSYGGMRKTDIIGRYQAVTEPFAPATSAAQKVPVLIIEADNDPLIPPQLRQQLRETYPEAAVHTLSGAGHFPYLNRPEVYTQILGGFFGKRNAGRSLRHRGR